MLYLDRLKSIANFNLVHILANIAEGVIIAYCILLALTLGHGLVLRSQASDDFRGWFIAFDELVSLFTYVWVSLISLCHLMIRTTRTLIRVWVDDRR